MGTAFKKDGGKIARVAVIVPHWNRLDDTTACYRCLMQLDHAKVDVYIVDNGSTVHTPEALASACPAARIVRLETNRGFAGGVNAGIRRALETDAPDFIWLVNNDTTCEPDVLTRMVRTAATGERIGLVGCELLEGAGRSPLRRVAAGKRMAPPLYIPWTVDAGQRVDYLSGASLLIRRAVLEEIGLLDEGYFFFFEDADYCRRARQAGWSLAVAPDAVMRHWGSATIGTLSEDQALYYRAGHVRFLRKTLTHPFAPALLCAGWRLLNDTLRGRPAAARGNLRGWRKGWREPVTGSDPAR